MDRIHESLEFRETYDETTRRMDQSLITVESNCHELRDYVEEQRKLINDSLRANSSDAKETRDLRATLNFYDHTRLELVSIEELCHEYRMKIRANLFSEIEQRLQPSLTCSLKALQKPIGVCDDAFLHPKSKQPHATFEESLCHWANVSPFYLDPAQDIVYGPKTPIPSKFDQSDFRFLQQIMELRSKIFSVSIDKRNEEGIAEGRRLSIGTATKREFIETVKKSDSFVLPSLEAELRKIGSLKFVDGEFKLSDAWARLLDTYGQQLRSKWFLIICPQIERLLKRRQVTMIRLSPTASFYFISKIPENRLCCTVSRRDLISLVEGHKEALLLKMLKKSGTLLRAIDGDDVAATIIQCCWRGYWVRKIIYEAECKYIAASIIWVAWIAVRNKRRMHERYIRNMLVSASTTRQLSLRFSREYSSITKIDHTVIHLPSVGLPWDVRHTFDSRNFLVYQNTMALKISLVKNPRTQVIYVLPVKLTTDLQAMYHDLLESVCPNANVQSRVTFLELSQAETFAGSSFNVSRTLHCSEDTLAAIRRKIVGNPAFILPWIMDECDLRLAGDLDVPLLAPDLEMQHRLLNRSYMSEMIDRLGLEQPAHVPNIKDYTTLCEKLADQVSLHTEICKWLFKLNVGLSEKHVGVFLINHISVPFMSVLRKEREAQGDQWSINSEVRMNFVKALSEHLPGVVSTVTRLSSCYKNWKDFYSHVIKYGCLLQAVPNEKSSSSVTVSIFIPGNTSGESPEWTGTAEKVYLGRSMNNNISNLASDSRCSSFTYTMPQRSVEKAHLEPVVGKLTETLQADGYFGYLCVDLYCFPHKREDKVIALVVETNPYYGHAQHLFDWMNFAIDGMYDQTSNTFHIGGPLITQSERQKSPSVILSSSVPKKETTQRFGAAISHLFHPRFSTCSWRKLRTLSKTCGVKWNATTKRGAHFIFHDATSKESAMIIAITPSMQATLTFMKRSLIKLRKALGTGTRETEGNLREAIHYFTESSRNYRESTLDPCNSLYDL